jgi:hypothetical protein
MPRVPPADEQQALADHHSKIILPDVSSVSGRSNKPLLAKAPQGIRPSATTSVKNGAETAEAPFTEC